MSFFDFGTASAAMTLAVRNSTFMKSSMEMRSSRVWVLGSGVLGSRFGVPGSGFVDTAFSFAVFLSKRGHSPGA